MCKDLAKLSNFITHFFSNLYCSKFDSDNCEKGFDKIRCYIPIIDEDYKSYCEVKMRKILEDPSINKKREIGRRRWPLC